MLAVLAGLLIWIFRGVTHSLIPLYAFGVFLSFTLSQLGMVRRWRKLQGPGWQQGVLLNGLGALCTAVVTVVFAVSKFREGAWIVVAVIPLLVLMLLKIRQHYRYVGARLSMEGYTGPQPFRHTVGRIGAQREPRSLPGPGLRALDVR